MSFRKYKDFAVYWSTQTICFNLIGTLKELLTRKTICWHQLQDLFIANFFQTLTFLGLEIDTHTSKDPFIG